MQTPRLALLAMILALAAPAMAAPPPEQLPARLLANARIVGSSVEAVVIVDGSRDGLFDRTGDTDLRVSRSAIEAAANSDERTALLAIILSYKSGLPQPVASRAAQVGDLLAGLVAADIDEGLAARDRANPYLNQPTRIRRWEPEPVMSSTSADDPLALRGLAWAKAAGVCEKTSVALLTRLGSGETNDLIATDARAVLKGLGVLRFSPDEHCRI